MIESGETHAAGLQNHLNCSLPLDDNFEVNFMSQPVMLYLKLVALLEDRNIDGICLFVNHTIVNPVNADAYTHDDLSKNLFGARI